MLLHFGIIPYLIFDGDFLPSKACTEVERAKRREESKRKGLEFYRLNKPSQAHLELQKAVDVTPAMARQLIDALKKAGVQYVVAPYEADAQLVYLEKNGMIDGIISEDSDLLVFGAKQLLTKLDQYGDCVEINRADFTACREISLVGWSDSEFRRMAILSGCDYLASMNKMGLKSAYRYVRKYKTIEKILQMLAFDGHYCIPTGYLEKFHKAELTFLHQRVFCPVKKKVVMMTEVSGEASSVNMSFIGADMEQKIAIGVAKGDLDPMTKQPIHIEPVPKVGPRTPWNASQKSMMNPSSDMKVKKPIDSFFKPQRTPLAELSCNSFTPSPTQERLLQRASGVTWTSTPLSSEPVSCESDSVRRSPHNRPSQSMFHSSTTPDNTVTSAGHQALKRRRLCLDSGESASAARVSPASIERSRFFPPVLSSISKQNKKFTKRRPGRNEIAIYSDDSLNDAMAELPDLPTSTASANGDESTGAEDVRAGKLTDPARTELRDEEDNGQRSHSSELSRDTELSIPSTNVETPNTNGSSSPVARVLDQHVTSELRSLAASWSYVPETEEMSFQRKEILESLECKKTNASTASDFKSRFQWQRSMTPLQRLGAGALNRTKSCSGLLSSSADLKENFEYRSPSIDQANYLNRMPSLPSLSTFGPDASMLKGSEDHIIPDSEASAEDSGSEAEDQVKPNIDLGRFAFLG